MYILGLTLLNAKQLKINNCTQKKKPKKCERIWVWKVDRLYAGATLQALPTSMSRV